MPWNIKAKLAHRYNISPIAIVNTHTHSQPWVLPSIKAAEEKLVKEGWNGAFQKEYAGSWTPPHPHP